MVTVSAPSLSSNTGLPGAPGESNRGDRLGPGA